MSRTEINRVLIVIGLMFIIVLSIGIRLTNDKVIRLEKRISEIDRSRKSDTVEILKFMGKTKKILDFVFPNE